MVPSVLLLLLLCFLISVLNTFATLIISVPQSLCFNEIYLFFVANNLKMYPK